ncbi:hypothetical protein [Stenotrophomonas sp.]|uniref:hypothetical protein n=1 Tax=Stenotrophomonas sp. TaxID=69392 RepID=UPI0028A7BAD7|nr:hypothetical protein [Stenotrophomonas sp.]
MTTPKFPCPLDCPALANTEDADEPRIPGFIDTLHRIGAGAAADGHPWPEPQLRLGRRIALADTDCALAGLRIVQELVLASERVRQNGPESEYLGDRVMEGLMMAGVALTAHATARARPAE